MSNVDGKFHLADLRINPTQQQRSVDLKEKLQHYYDHLAKAWDSAWQEVRKLHIPRTVWYEYMAESDGDNVLSKSFGVTKINDSWQFAHKRETHDFAGTVLSDCIVALSAISLEDRILMTHYLSALIDAINDSASATFELVQDAIDVLNVVQFD